MEQLIEPSFNFLPVRLEGRRASKEYRNKIKEMAGSIIWAPESLPFVGRIKWQVELNFYTHRPRDIDNLVKPVLDALTGGYWENDSQIQKLLANKYSVGRKEQEGFSIRLWHENFVCRGSDKGVTNEI